MKNKFFTLKYLSVIPERFPTIIFMAASLLFFPFTWVANAEPQKDIEKSELLLFFEEKDLMVKGASHIEEPLTEAPAVVNIITQEDIKILGARNLLDVLYTIPGFFDIQDINEHVAAGRGVYATSTHKFLLLRDGHRLNDPLFEDIMPENSISLASIKRIEVMRGPGASLYGNAALLGVINIVTVDEKEPSRVSVGAGNFGQETVDLIYNTPLSGNRQFLFFSSFYNSEGERITLDSSRDFSKNAVSGEQDIDRRPLNYDIGIKYKGEETLLSLSTRRASYDTPRGNLGQILTQNDTLVDPQQDLYNTHLDFQYMPKWNDIKFNLRHYLDYSKVITPQYSEVSRNALPNGKAFNLELEDMRGGIEYSGAIEHRNGTAIVGLQAEAFRLLDSKIETSFDDQTTLRTKQGLPEETEWLGAIYIQEKYNLIQNLILNGGIRWDYYEAFGNSINPRIAIVYNPAGRFYAKAIYAKAFQAPSYFYRKENQGLGYGATTKLEPEKMDTYQLSLENWFNDKGWFRMTFFYNELKDLISRPAGASTYQNFGKMTTEGIETEARVEVSSVTLFANHSYIRPVKSDTDASLIRDDELINYPSNIINGGIVWKYNVYLSGSFYASWHDDIKSPIGTSSTAYRYEPDNEIHEAAIFNLAINAQNFYKGLEASLKVHNLFDERDLRGGTVLIPYPQEGRNIFFNIGYRF
ncbi:MAG: TonB-dependent receptor [Deltaproteobacteria bacterium]|nr:TonB-dependent receptor [Deltaproteobacteria bacterium]